MITGLEKIDKCCQEIKDCAQKLYETYHNVIITSGYRTPESNAALGIAAPSSQHLPQEDGLARAMDVTVPNIPAFEIAAVVYKTFPTVRGLAINVYKNFTHVDFKKCDKLRQWAYGKNGKEA